MRRLVLAALASAALTAPAGPAASAPAWTAKGKVTALTARSITVHGSTCRIIVKASPARATLHLFAVGSGAKIACENGILRRIVRIGVTAPRVTPTPSALDTLPVTRPATTEPPSPGPPTISAG